MLELQSIRFGYADGPMFLGPVEVHVRPGEFWAIVGPNGAGKSTLLRIMAGLLVPQSGAMSFAGQRYASYSRRDRARTIAFLPQRATAELNMTAREIVLMGRFPHRSLGLFESALDYEIAQRELDRTSTLDFADRLLSTLSGGEAQRVHLAATFAGEPRLLLLDEPTASLDLQQERLIFDLLRRRAAENGMAVVVVTHDLNLAADFCTHALLLHEGKVVAHGPPRIVLTPRALEPVYGLALAAVDAPGGDGRRWLVPATTTPLTASPA